ncbi:tripartite tricarboxylate transporter substrate binding protein [Polynucleobacter sp. AP-Latsch-80-C2]|jgi:tripartite-type tricarboxylate transporter receptor subunit TctC|uniref:Bug family tripartite tricarboxylate transporter substrate binding protein n=1 Tax=Polynucleobacter sp. AP-Latsch-80-C2 TaxID=2576931 RepID=UPI001C0B2E0D|nr:tripartite tricarboxylate transporter substrate binding protein [Polynucleobacter sp. AP-Latsch-80-C2]MBU3624308.1 tripartite tricarboxylate transporter substrate binding protein [Polynucleobacter sp. AP-Latsch-80-C2]
MLKFSRFWLVLLSSLVVISGVAIAAPYPEKPIKLIVAWSPGGTTDILARIIAQGLSEKLGQTVLVENKPGGGNNIGTEYVVRSAPDGYTLNMTNPANAINASLYKTLSFNFINDTVPVAGVVRTPNVMVVTAALPVKNVEEFIAYCKANPTKVNMASSGSGSSIHLSGELFKIMTGCKMAHIPYKGAGPALNDLIAGQVQVMFDNLPSSSGFIKDGRIRALAVTTSMRETSLPNVPTVAETVPGYEASAWFGVSAPKGTPREIVEKLNVAVNQLLADPKIQKRLSELGGTPIPGTPEDFGKLISSDTQKWERVVKTSGATVD